MSPAAEALSFTPPNTPVVYLDFDGVLHHKDVYMNDQGYVFMDAPQRAAGRKLFEWAHLLARILNDKPQVQVILSTTWARKVGMRSTVLSLAERLDAKVLGSTFEVRIDGASDAALDHFMSLNRSQQIHRDAARRGLKNWIALDDDYFGWPDQSNERLIPCNGETGISNPDTLLLLEEKIEAICEHAIIQADLENMPIRSLQASRSLRRPF